MYEYRAATPLRGAHMKLIRALRGVPKPMRQTLGTLRLGVDATHLGALAHWDCGRRGGCRGATHGILVGYCRRTARNSLDRVP